MNNIDKLSKAFIKCMDDNNKYNTLESPYCMGIITNINPLNITVEKISFIEEDLLIPYYLKEWNEEVNIITTSNGDPSHSHEIKIIHHPSKFKLNARVLLYGIEPDKQNCKGSYQRYIVLGVL